MATVQLQPHRRKTRVSAGDIVNTTPWIEPATHSIRKYNMYSYVCGAWDGTTERSPRILTLMPHMYIHSFGVFWRIIDIIAEETAHGLVYVRMRMLVLVANLHEGLLLHNKVAVRHRPLISCGKSGDAMEFPDSIPMTIDGRSVLVSTNQVVRIPFALDDQTSSFEDAYQVRMARRRTNDRVLPVVTYADSVLADSIVGYAVAPSKFPYGNGTEYDKLQCILCSRVDRADVSDSWLSKHHFTAMPEDVALPHELMNAAYSLRPTIPLLHKGEDASSNGKHDITAALLQQYNIFVKSPTAVGAS
jgi:hypothetical protein